MKIVVSKYTWIDIYTPAAENDRETTQTIEEQLTGDVSRYDWTAFGITGQVKVENVDGHAKMPHLTRLFEGGPVGDWVEPEVVKYLEENRFRRDARLSDLD